VRTVHNEQRGRDIRQPRCDRRREQRIAAPPDTLKIAATIALPPARPRADASACFAAACRTPPPLPPPSPLTRRYAVDIIYAAGLPPF
jgi:hypothetical protein